MRPIDADALETKQKAIYMEFDNVAVPTRVISIADLHLAPTVDAMPKWISVEDRLPEDDQDVLVCVNKNTIDTGYCSFGYDPSVRNWYAYAAVSNNVTHWMPLPEPPKEDENEG